MKIVIIGNGIAGITAARHIRKMSSHSITVISSESKYFFSRTALMYVYMGHMKFEHTKPYEDWFWKKNRIDLVMGHVVNINTKSNQLTLQSGKMENYDVLILATGSKPVLLGWPGQHLNGVQGLYSLRDLELMEKNTKAIKQAVLVGGGLIGIEMAEMLLARNIEVTFLVREKAFWNNVLPIQEASLISRHIREHGVKLFLETELLKINGNETGRVREIITNKGLVIPCQFVGLTVGVEPSIDFLKGSEVAYRKGILVNEFLQTNIPNIFAVGDCAELTSPLPGRNLIEPMWYTGKIMGETVAKTICEKKTIYDPGTKFNSAKFLDIEFQSYGDISPELNEADEEFYWEKDNRAFHFVWKKKSRQFYGVNVFGIRLRHQYVDRWLKEKRSIDYVIDHLHESNFDPEFFPRFEIEVKNKFKTSGEFFSNQDQKIPGK